MEVVETTLKNLRPQPSAQATTTTFYAWRKSLLDQIARIETTRAANHPLGTRLKNMKRFIDEQTRSMSHLEGPKLVVEAGTFFWFLVRLLQRQEGMKALLEEGDPIIRELDPRLRKRIKAGWNVVEFSPRFTRLVCQLNSSLQAGRKSAWPNKALQPRSRGRRPAANARASRAARG
jgi:hypothetical protein